MPGPTLEHIIGTLGERRKARGPQVDAMRRVRDAYNGDIVVPLPELDRHETASVINFVNTGIDQLAARIASVTPDVYYPSLREGIKLSEEKARTRRKANLSWWRTNKMDTKLSRRARHLIGYAESPVILRPNMRWGISKWETRNPLSTYPCPTGDPDDIQPPDTIFTFQRSYGWLARFYPEAAATLNTGANLLTGKRCDPADLFEIVEYVDGDSFVLAALGKNVNPVNAGDMLNTPGAPFVELERLPNRAETPPAVVAGRITLDRPMGQFDGMIGMYQTMARLTALEIIAVERGIFSDKFLVSRPNETARFLAGPFDGRTGQVNIVAGGDIKELTQNPSFAANSTVDRIERAARGTGGIPSEFGGESPSNVRTGKRGDAVFSAQVEMPIAEAQKMLAQSLEAENRIAVAQAKAYFGSQRKSFFIDKTLGHVDYVPNEVFETDTNIVSYPLAGADQNGMIIGIGQRVGMGTMSKQTGAELDPMIADAEMEKRRIVAETLDQAVLGALVSQSQSGMIPVHDAARIKTLVMSGKSIEEAVEQAQTEAQQRQATPAPAGSPETQPGLAPEGVGAEQPAAIEGPNQSQGNLSDLLNALRRPTQQSRAERGAA